MNIMWICMDERNYVTSGRTPQEAFDEYENEIGVSSVDRCSFYKLDIDKPVAVKTVITEVE